MIDLSYLNVQGGVEKEQETANSYVISSPGSYCFPLIYGNAIKHGKENPGSYTGYEDSKRFDFPNHKSKPIKTSYIPYEADSVKISSWDSSREFIQGLRIQKDYIEFDVPYIPEEGANYVISVIDGSFRISWSWHIWLWKEKLENMSTKHGYKILNYNLATKQNSSGDLLSWFYQFGRKDPICFLRKQYVVKETAKKLGHSSLYPNSFFLSGKYANYNWAEVKYMPNYWKADNGKSVFDPCPRDYRIPDLYVIADSKVQLPKNGGISPIDGSIVTGLPYPPYDIFGIYWENGSIERGISQAATVIFTEKGQIIPVYREKSYGLSVRPQYDRS